MASITIQQSHKNLIFAALVADHCGASFREEGQWITIERDEALEIPHYLFIEAFDPDGSRSRRYDDSLERAWRSLLLNKRGYLRSFSDQEIYITDDAPEEKRPAYVLRWNSQGQYEQAQEWAERAGYTDLRSYILEAIEQFNRWWATQAKEEPGEALSQ